MSSLWTDANVGYYVIGVFLFAMCIGVIPGFIALSKGRDFVTWWIFGTLLFIVALPASLFIKSVAEREETPASSKDDPRTLALLEAFGIGKTVQALPQPATSTAAALPITKTCPDCAEDVRVEARKCRFCGYRFDSQPGLNLPEQTISLDITR